MITKKQVQAIVDSLISEADLLVNAREPEQRQWREIKAEARQRVRALDSKRSK